jgi:hypothetical protein
MEKMKIILPIHSAVAPHVSASGVMSAPDSAVDRQFVTEILEDFAASIFKVVKATFPPCRRRQQAPLKHQ